MGPRASRGNHCDCKSRNKRVCLGGARKVNPHCLANSGLQQLTCNQSRLVSVARGEQDYFSPEGIPTAVEGCKSTALRRCCKDLGIASELWDPRFIRRFMAENVKEVFVEHQVSKKRRKIYLRKDEKVQYPFKETKYGSGL